LVGNATVVMADLSTYSYTPARWQLRPPADGAAGLRQRQV
jgi:hypothetical protein